MGVGKFVGNLEPVSVMSEGNDLPVEYKLYNNYQNPFNPSTTIRYSIPSQVGASSTVFVQLKIYDILGREVQTLVSETKNPGNYEATFEAKNLASGIYLYMLKAGNFIQVKKMILLR